MRRKRRLAEQPKIVQPVPKAGGGCTFIETEDIYRPFSIIRVWCRGTRMLVREDRITMTGGWMKNKSGEKHLVTLRADGRWKKHGDPNILGPHFLIGDRQVKVPRLDWSNDDGT